MYISSTYCNDANNFLQCTELSSRSCVSAEVIYCAPNSMLDSGVELSMFPLYPVTKTFAVSSVLLFFQPPCSRASLSSRRFAADNKIATNRDGKYLPPEKIVQNSSRKTEGIVESKDQRGKRRREGQREREFPLLSTNSVWVYVPPNT